MCGPNSVSAVQVEKKVAPKKTAPAGPAVTVTATKFIFMVSEGGLIGTSHSATRTAAKFTGKSFVNVNLRGSELVYENGIQPFYAKNQAKNEKALLALYKKIAVSGPAYAKKVAVARRILDKANVAALELKGKAQTAATKKAEATFAASKKAAFATLAKLGGIAE
jgi:hypothetical protein